MFRLPMLMAAAGVFLVAAAGGARSAVIGCEAFKAAMLRDSGDLKAEFVRPLMVSRGAASSLSTFDLVSRAKIDGALRCNEDAFVAFEARIVTPADGDLISRFARVQEAAGMAAFGWSESQAQRRVHELSAQASDYLRASSERGDVAVSGKIEEHLSGGLELGVIWTPTDRTFLVLRNE